MKEKWIRVFEPLWAQFWAEIGDADVLNGPVPHLPHCGDFKQFEESKYKIAFVGIDAWGWGDNLQKYKHGSIERYLSDCQEEMDGTGNWANTNPVFWNFVFKVLEKLYQVPFKELKQQTTQESQDIIKGIVWGNMASIGKSKDKPEVPNWQLIKNASRVFDNFDYLPDVFSPQVIFLLNFRDSKNHYEYTSSLQGKYIDSFDEDVDYYLLERENGTKSSVFVTYHPRAMKTQGVDQELVIDEAVSRIINSRRD